jgi:four helix bundle protein
LPVFRIKEKNIMTNQDSLSFNQQLRDRTLAFAVRVQAVFQSKKIDQLNRSSVNQVLRCSSSVAANYRSATRARSDAEYFSKICIVTEECDEAQFWLEYLTRTGFLSEIEVSAVKDEAD